MRNTLLAGSAAGTAGTAALDAVSYLDMLVRARPASTTPEEAARRVAEALHLSLSASGSVSDAAANRRTALGALLGLAAGLTTGVAFGLVRPRLGRVPLAVLGVGAGLVANIGTTGPMVLLGVTDPRTWSASSWLSDVFPHLAYGLTTAGSFELMWRSHAARRAGFVPRSAARALARMRRSVVRTG